jgi:hypothetical protein
MPPKWKKIWRKIYAPKVTQSAAELESSQRLNVLNNASPLGPQQLNAAQRAAHFEIGNFPVVTLFRFALCRRENEQRPEFTTLNK